MSRQTARGARVRRGRTRVLYKQRYKSGGGVLGGTNADTRMVYRKKAMPKRKRNQWKRFVKKVGAVNERDLGSRVLLINDQIQQTVTTVGQQNCMTLALYGNTNPTNGWLNDLKYLQGLENAGDPTAAAGGTVDQSTKFIFTSAVMDVTIRNSSTYKPVNNPVQLDGRAAIELDIYEMYQRNDSNDGLSASHDSISAELNAYNLKRIGGQGSGIAIEDRGASPFEFGNSLGQFGIKVVKKTKFFIPNNQTITYQVRDPKRRVTTQGNMNRKDGWNYPGWTRVIFLVYKLVPGLVLGTAATDDTFQCQCTIGSTRTYKYKVEGFNEDRERFNGSSYAITTAAS